MVDVTLARSGIRVKVTVGILRSSVWSFLNFSCFRSVRSPCGHRIAVAKSPPMTYSKASFGSLRVKLAQVSEEKGPSAYTCGAPSFLTSSRNGTKSDYFLTLRILLVEGKCVIVMRKSASPLVFSETCACSWKKKMFLPKGLFICSQLSFWC